jgi:hypothetical protein
LLVFRDNQKNVLPALDMGGGFFAANIDSPSKTFCVSFAASLKTSRLSRG